MTKQRDILVANTLTYSGTLPLIGSVVLLHFPMTVATVLPMAGLDGALIASTYSAVIISFLCGIHWAAYLLFADRCPRHLLIISNIVALFAWLSLLLGNHVATTLLQAGCFLLLLALDVTLRNAGIHAEWFFRLRRNATLIVVLCLLLIVAANLSPSLEIPVVCQPACVRTVPDIPGQHTRLELGPLTEI